MKNRVVTALLSVVIAFALWMYVITVERTEIEETFYNVPVILDSETVLEDRGLMITSDTDLTVTLKLSGNRSDLNKLRSSDITVMADLSRIYESGEKKLSYDVSFPGDVKNNAIEVVSRHPDSVNLTVVKWDTKVIPISLAYIGSVPEGYNADKQNATLDVNSVTVTGPEDIISQIEMAKVTVDLAGRTQTLVDHLRYSLCDGSGNPIADVSTVTTDRGEVRVTVPVQMVKDVKLTYTVTNGGGLTAQDVTITPNYDTITVAGSPAALAELEEISLGSIDLGVIAESQQLILPIRLPEGVTNQSGITEVTMDIVLPELEIRIYSLTNFRIENVPQGMTAEIINKVLNVKIRGMGPVLDQLKAEDIVVVVDFSGAEHGRFTLPAVIEIKAFDNVGAVESYYVNVNVTES